MIIWFIDFIFILSISNKKRINVYFTWNKYIISVKFVVVPDDVRGTIGVTRTL